MLIKLFTLVVISLTLLSCTDSSTKFQGYMEGEYLYMAPMVAGHLDKLAVQRGQLVESGGLLFIIEQTDQIAQLKQAQEQVKSSHAILKDMLVGKRPPELDAIKAQIRQAKSSRDLAEINLKRDSEQFQIGAIPKSQLDASASNYKVAIDRLRELQHDLDTANLPGRKDQIKSQHALYSYAAAGLTDSEWKLSQTIGKAPESSLVYDTLYNVGEWVTAGNPVVILLPPHNLKIRFFVPEISVSHIKLGERLKINCDGCKSDIFAHVTYMSDQAEYTPPVIYSNETRNQLVFRVEAKPEHPDLLGMHPGQPVEVVLHD
ncbi:MAG TPA: HlyD family efflux transporter periplasmic adaptor subunit [Aquella sp.]|nr:HlyD family efflux transporter periplasmic adaptor subunit [Aquella sp.]